LEAKETDSITKKEKKKNAFGQIQLERIQYVARKESQSEFLVLRVHPKRGWNTGNVVRAT
jgi:hypothetical protein